MYQTAREPGHQTCRPTHQRVNLSSLLSSKLSEAKRFVAKSISSFKLTMSTHVAPKNPHTNMTAHPHTLKSLPEQYQNPSVQEPPSSHHAFMLNMSDGAWPLFGRALFSADVGSDLPSWIPCSWRKCSASSAAIHPAISLKYGIKSSCSNVQQPILKHLRPCCTS